MLSGQAHVYLGEKTLTCGAAKHRNSHPPLFNLHQFTAGKDIVYKNAEQNQKNNVESFLYNNISVGFDHVV